MKKLLLVIILTTSIIINIIFAYYFYKPKVIIKTDSKLDKYPYLAKRILLENPSDIIINFVKLRQQLNGYVSNTKTAKVGVYFEYLYTGQNIGINEREIFYVASLPKIPMAMEALKEVENKTLFLNQNLTIKKEHLNDAFGNLYKKGEGAQTSVEEAIKLSIINSDNTAYEVLKDSVKDKNLEKLYEYFDIPEEKVEQGRAISPKNYSSILKSLFFSSYLSLENSNKLLGYMSIPADFDLLSKAVPKNIKVANKFGIYSITNDQNQVYSDCGIVFIPNRRYILCVMVNGEKSYQDAGKHIENISKIVYDYVSSANAVKISKR